MGENMRINKIKSILGRSYSFQQILTEKEVNHLQSNKPYNFIEMVAATLIAGCVRIDAILFELYGTLKLGYDVFVKDHTNSLEWICYDTLSDNVSLEEESMFIALDNIVKKYGLSYTECNFEILEGKQGKK